MSKIAASEIAFIEHFDSFNSMMTSTQPNWLNQKRADAFTNYRTNGLPTGRRGNESWKYTDVRDISNTAFANSSEDLITSITEKDLLDSSHLNKNWSTLVFINGVYSSSLSTQNPNDGIQITNIKDALGSHGQIIERHLGKYIAPDDDPFVLLNTAFINDGAFIYIPKGIASQDPIHVIYFSTSETDPTISHPRTLIVTEEFSETTLIESYVGTPKAKYFTNNVTEIVIGEESRVDHYRLLLDNPDSFHIGTTVVHQEKASTFSSTSLQKGAALGRHNLTSTLAAPQSTCNLNGLYMTTGSQHIDNYINIEHIEPHTTSRLYYKGILDGSSRAIFGGTVTVQRGAMKTDAQQKDKNLLLSREAEVDSKPALFIYADDVICGHGATAGHMDDNSVFYMQSRGIDLLTARRMLIKAFASEIIEEVKIDSLREYLEDLFVSFEDELTLLQDSSR